MSSRTLLVIAAAVMLLAAPLAHAVETAGRITGVVVDPTGLPVESAQVRLTGKNLIGGPRQQNTKADGDFTFINLPPGDYEVTVTSEGFRDTRQEGIKVSVGSSVQLDVVLEPPVATTTEAYVVTARPETVDTEKTSTGVAINQSFTGRIPTSRDYQGIALMAPGVIGAPGGGDSGAAGNPVIHGANPYSNQYLIDGINMTDPVTNTFSRNFNFDAIEDIEVLTGGRDAEYGSATGGVINVVTKSGGNNFSADGSLYFSPDLSFLARRRILTGDSPFIPEGLNPYRRDERPRAFQFGEANLNVGGPIVEDKLWFFVSNQVSFNQGQLEKSAFPDVTPAPREFRAYYGLGKLTYQARSWQRFQLLIQGDPTSISNTTQSPTTHPDAEEHQNQGGGLVMLSSDTNIGEHFLLRNKLAFFSSYIQVYPESGDFETPGRINTTTGTETENARRLFRDTRNRIQYSPQLVISWEPPVLGSHETKIGMDAMFSWNRIYDTMPGGRYYQDTGIPDDPSMRGSPAEEVRIVEPQNNVINGDTFGFYVQDAWKPFRTLTIRPGLRFDSSRMRNDTAGSWNDVIATNARGGLSGWLDAQGAAVGNIFDATIIHLNALSPRIAVAWDPFADGRTNLHAGYFRYADTSYLLFPSAVGRSTHTRYYSYNPATGRYDLPGREEGGPSGFVVKNELSGFNPRHPPNLEDVDLSKPWAPSIQGWDPLQVITGHHVPKTDEIVVGMNRELIESVSLSADLIGRLITNLYEDDETNLIWSEDGSRVIDGRNGKQDVVYSLGTPDAAYQIYYGVDLSLRKQLTDRFEGLISYTFSVNRGTTNAPFSIAFDREKQFKYLFGFLEFDRRHVLRMQGYYHLPLGFVVGGRLSYLSGSPYNKFKQNQFFGDYGDLAAPRGYDPDNPGRELRMPDLLDTNLRLMWDAEDLTGLKLWLIMDVENALNLRTPTVLEERDLPEGSPTQWGDVLDRQAPIQFTFGARFRY